MNDRQSFANKNQKTRTTVLCMQIAENKDRSPLQTKGGTRETVLCKRKPVNIDRRPLQTNSGKQGRSLKAEDKDSSPLQMNSRRQGRSLFQIKSGNKDAVLCKQKRKVSSVYQWHGSFHQLWGDSNPGQQSILVLLGQQSHMPMREQQFVIFYKKMLAIETTVSSANLWNSRFHQPWGGGGSISPSSARTAVHLNFAGTAVPYAYEIIAFPHILQSVSSYPCFYQDTSPLQTKEWKTRTAVSLQTNSRKQGQHFFQSDG